MSTFAGRYLKEPSDFSTVASEGKLIRAFGDGIQFRGQTFADLEPSELVIVQGVANPLIIAAERVLDSYAELGGYAIPLSPLDSDAVDLAVQWAWIAALQRGDTLSLVDANKQRQELRDGPLTDIATGKLLLTAASAVAVPAQSAMVYDISDAATRSGGQVDRMSRELLRRF